MSVWRDMARDAGMEPLDEAAAYIEQQERERHENSCFYSGHQWAAAGDGRLICMECESEQRA
jgi:hypothetical protein